MDPQFTIQGAPPRPLSGHRPQSDLLSGWVSRGLDSLTAASAAWTVWAVGIYGVLAAAGVAYVTAQNPRAAPVHAAVAVRVVIIVTLIGAAIYAHTSKVQARMAPALLVAGLFAPLWLLNGSGGRIGFSVGLLFSGISPTVFYYLLLAHPEGSLHTRSERRLLLGVGTAAAIGWAVLLLTSHGIPLRTPLLRCGSHCPRNALYLGALPADVGVVLRAAEWVFLTAMVLGTLVLVNRRTRRTARRLRRALIPIELAAVASATGWVAFLAAQIVGSRLTGTFGGAYITVAAVIPLAILVGLLLERSSIGRGLAMFINRLALNPSVDPEALMRNALSDPSLEIAYYASGRGAYVDSSGAPAQLPDGELSRAVTKIDNDGVPVAAVSYDSTLADQDTFVQAAAAAVIMRLQREQLEAELRASTQALVVSRQRLVDASNAERQRIERDLHDGIQQHLVGLRLKLELASEVVGGEPERGQRMLASLGRQLDELLGTMRSLARGIYPSLLTEHGLAEALRAVARRSPLPVAVRARGLGRYPEDVEVAIYFCCLEAFQNAIKHSGADASVEIRLHQERGRVYFAVHDDGVGFDPDAVGSQHGLLNMRDRIEAVSGSLSITSRTGIGTTVRGAVPTR